MPSSPQIFVSAGEASGERYGAMLMEAVRALRPDVEFFGLGGTAMEAAGCERVVRAEDIAVMGITEVLRHMPRIYREYRRLVRSIRTRKPGLAVLIDFPDVNFRLAKELKKSGIPVVYFVSPQLWAWKQYRVRWVRERVSKMLVIFPFEEKYYRDHGVDAEFVGHPLADLPLPTISRKEYASQYKLDPAKEWIALLPGSRGKELRHNLPVMAGATNLLGTSYEFLLPAAATLDPEWVRRMVAQCQSEGSGIDIPIHVVEDARAALFHARASVVASGTATVEAALIGNPFIAVYRLSDFSYAVASRLVDLPHVAMVNLIAEDRIVPELIQDDFTPENIVRALQPLLDETGYRSQMIEELRSVKTALHWESNAAQFSAANMIQTPEEIRSHSLPERTAIDRAAAWVLDFLDRAEAECSPIQTESQTADMPG
ncbi:MAG TPA: lipid-A-disaccharide synthase [Acidobacteriaceae bacterium]|nr:lipid-A-disaccharide synthase [Acidobacteriaceae bacterium]